MNEQLVRILGNVDAAEAARKHLLAEGFDGAGITIAVAIDEAGPGVGNFVVGDAPSVKGSADYQAAFAPGEHAGHCVMTVRVPDAAQLARAAAILDHFGARDVDVARAVARDVADEPASSSS